MDWFRNVRSSTTQQDNATRNNVNDNNVYNNNNNNTTNNEESSYLASAPSRPNHKSTKDDNKFMLPSSTGNKILSSPPREDLTCALCGEMYTDPRILPCLHSFCKRCLEHTVNPRSTTLACHLCRKEITLKVEANNLNN